MRALVQVTAMRVLIGLALVVRIAGFLLDALAVGIETLAMRLRR